MDSSTYLIEIFKKELNTHLFKKGLQPLLSRDIKRRASAFTYLLNKGLQHLLKKGFQHALIKKRTP